MLKVININSTIDLPSHDCAFVEQVIIYAEKDSRWKPNNHLSPILDKIPVFLVSKENMPKLPDYLKGKKWDMVPPIELLGYYTRIEHASLFPNPNNKFLNSPAVYICPENIKILCKPQNIEGYQTILADVFIHEFAHAKMDDDGEEFDYMDKDREFFDSIEEPFANWFVLEYFYFYGNGNYFSKVISAMAEEPSFYRLGCNFFNSKIDENSWEGWGKNKKRITLNTPREEKDYWLNTARNIVYSGNEAINVKEGLENILK
jgi:hypothetical protein